MRAHRLAFIAWLVALGGPACANGLALNTLVVNTTVDGHDVNGCTPASCTLRDAILNSAPSGGTTITFAVPLPATIQMQSGTGIGAGAFEINNTVSVSGPGASLLRIVAPSLDRIADVNGSQVFLTGLTLSGGFAASPSSYGASARGGCLHVIPTATLTLNRVDVRDCTAQATDGAPGALGGYGTPGGPGGDALGGAIYVAGALELLNSSVVNNTTVGGSGGTGADGDPTFFTSGGNGGNGGIASGGGIYVAPGGWLHIKNSTVAGNASHAGWGGDAGSDAFGSFAGGGPGGDAQGGLVAVAAASGPVDIEFSTFAVGSLLVGQGGSGGPGNDGSSGNAAGADVFAGSTVTALSSAIVGANPVSLCSGTVTPNGVNLDEDNSCGFALHDTLANLFRPLDISNTAWPGYMPVWHSGVVDAALSCDDLSAVSVTADQHGTSRPQANACDLGAIEADYIFVDGFDG